MGLNIKNKEVERLVKEVAEATGESMTEAIRQAMLEKQRRLSEQGKLTKSQRLRKVLEDEIWPALPPETRGKSISKLEREEILGYGPSGF